jgi:pimeloyl-ACP methyl ester carboxylesterase
MSLKNSESMDIPFLLPGRIVSVPGRGEMFVRHFHHSNPTAPTVLLVHGWTASCDVQFFTAYEALSHEYSIIGVDHCGHGRGVRPNVPFSLEECADDAAAVVRALSVTKVITVGYSMGGPISILIQHRHPELVAGMVFQATAREFNSTRAERNRWRVLTVFGPLFRLVSTPRLTRTVLHRLLGRGHEIRRYVPWIIGETGRNDVRMVNQAGRALSRFVAPQIVNSFDVPTSCVITTRDRGVLPELQYALAKAYGSEMVELQGDHSVTLQQPHEYATATCRAVNLVVAAIQQR